MLKAARAPLRATAIAVVAPASPFRAARSSTPGLAELRRLGFEPVYEPSVFDRDGYVAGAGGDARGGHRDRARAIRRCAPMIGGARRVRQRPRAAAGSTRR